MKITDSNEHIRTLSINDKEWFDRTSFGQKAEEIIARKLADSFTDEELQKLVKVNMRKVEKIVVEMIARRVVDMCINSKTFKEEE